MKFFNAQDHVERRGILSVVGAALENVRAPVFFVQENSGFPLVFSLSVLSALCGLVGLVLGLLFAPASAQMGETYRIILVHVPASWMSMLLYLGMVACASANLLGGNRRAVVLARAIAPTGALMTMLSLATGAIWGLPTWGAWWVWDARLIAMLVLFIFYMGFIVLNVLFANQARAERVGSFWLLAGVGNLLMIHYSVHWWHSLHQGATFSLGKTSLISPFMVWGLLLMVLSFSFYAATMILLRLPKRRAAKI